MNVLQALWLRAQQEKDAIERGRLGLGEDPTGPGVGVPDVPVLGGAARIPLAAIHALGLINEGAGNTAEAAMGTLGGAIVGGQQAGYYALHPDEAPSEQDRHYIAAWDQLRHGHPIAANQEMGRADAFMNAIGTFALNPLNVAGAGEAAPLMRAAARLGEGAPATALRAVSRGGHIVNELPVSPIKALLAAKRADQGERAAAAGAAVLRALLGREAPAADAAGRVARSLADVPLESDVPLGPGLPGVQGPPRPGRRVVPETILPETSSIPGNAKRPLGPALPPLLDVPLPPELGPALPTRGNLPKDQLIPRIGRNGGKGIGPLLPPELGPAVPEMPPALQSLADLLNAGRKTAQPTPLEGLLGAAKKLQLQPPVPVREIIPPEAITPAEEAAAKAATDGHPDLLPPGAAPDLPGYQGQTRREALGALTSDEIDNLVNLAYPVEKAQANAINAHRDPLELADAALARIQQPGPKGQELVARLQQLHPDLAEKIAFLPEPEDVAALADEPAQAALSNVDFPPSITAPAERAAWQARYVGQSQAGTDILAAGDKVAGGDLTQADLNALSPQERLAALRKLAAEPASAPVAAPVEDWRTTAGPDAQELIAGIEDAVKRGAVDEANELVRIAPDFGVPENRAQDILNAAADAGRKGTGVQARIEQIEQSPYFRALDYFTTRGELKRVNPTTGRPIVGIRQGGEEIWNLPGSGYDEVAAGILSSPEFGHNQNFGMTSDEFWRNARDTIREYWRLKKPRATLGGGDLAAGGGGFGLVPARLGTTLAGAGVGTGVGGLAGGGLGLAAGHRDDQLKEDVAAGAGLGALAGGSVGSVGPEIAQAAPQVARHLAAASQGTMRSPTMYARAWRAGLAGQAEAAQAAGPRGIGGFVKALPAQWRSSVVMTFKQIPQDAITRWVTLWGLARKELGVADPDIARWQETIAAQRDAGAPLDTTVERTLRALGQDTLATPAGIHEVYGTDYLSAEAARRRSPLNRGQSAAAGAIFSAFNGLRQVNPLSVAAGAVKGRYQPFINGFVQFLNGVQHDAFRYAMAEKTLARDIPPLSQALIADLQARGVNVAPLVAKGGFFSGADVAAVAGPAIGTRWDTLVEETIRNGGDRVAFLAGDFRDKAMLPGEKALAAVVPFVRWPLHYGPVFAEIAANHPRLAAVAAGILANQREQAKQAGSKAYEAATTPITTEAPVLGGLARLRLGGQRGVLRAGLLGAVVPYANLAGGVDLPGEDAGPYEKATAIGDAVGFSPNPLIQAGAYVTGLDYRAPGALSRTAGLEGAAGLLPGPLGRLSIPAPGAALDAAREALTGQSSEYDPVMRRYAELVLDRTGAELAADENEPYLAFATPEARALYERAKREVLTAGAVGNLASVASPVSLAARSAEGEAIRAAKANVPYSADLIARMSPDLAATMQAVNARYLAGVPATRAYRGASASAREGLLLGDIADRSPTNYLLDPLTRRQLQEAQRREIRRTQPR
jgi:hypothetical protein